MTVLFLRKIGVFLIAGVLVLSGFFVVHAQPTKDPYVSEQWYLQAAHVPTEPQVGKESVVAILDAGFDLQHEDLKNQYWTNVGEVAGDQKDNDHNGYEDDVHGWDFVQIDNNPSPDISDTNADDTIVSHGTLLAGMIAAETNNGKGIVGIAPHSKIMPLRILDSKGRGTTAGVRDAIVYAVKNGADVINLSLVSTKPDDLLQQTIEWAVDQGVVVVAAVGNDALDVDRDPSFPACFDTRIGKNRVIGVAALDQNGKKASFSNDGSNCVDLAAPGVNIFGAVYHSDTDFMYSTSYGSPFEGTSVAAPMVSAAAARLRSAYPSLTPEQIRLDLMLSADPITAETPEQRARLGAGSLNIERALQIAPRFVGMKSETDSTSRKQQPTGSVFVAQGTGNAPMVKRLDANGKEKASFFAYDKKFFGGVRVAVGDVNGDGVEEVVTAPGAGGGPQIRIFDVNGKFISQFFAFDSSDRHGVVIAVGDVNGDGLDEILSAIDGDGNGQVRIYSMRGDLLGSFYPFGRTTFPVRMTVGNFDDDAQMEIVASLGGKDKSHRVKIFDGNGRYIRDFSAMTFLKNGLRVATLHGQNTKKDQILVMGDVGSAPWIGLFDELGKMQISSMAFASGFLGGVSVVASDVGQNGSPKLFVVPSTIGGPQIRVFDYRLNVIGGFFAFDAKTRGGLSIATWNP